MNKLKFFSLKYFDDFKIKVGVLSDDFSVKIENFDYLIKTSSVYSANIEGNSIDVNSFMNYEMQQKFKKNRDIQEILDLIGAYNFAKNNELNSKNFLKVHEILASNLLDKNFIGKYRDQKVGVFDDYGLVYLAIEPEFLEQEMQQFFEDVNILLSKNLTIEEVFYFASFLHLRIAHIHPFMDGNGRIARILEKWFLAQKLGEKFWALQSEKFYKENQNKYYKNINLGVNFYELDYAKCVDFLCMLPKTLDLK